MGYHGVPLPDVEPEYVPADVPDYVRHTARFHIGNDGPIVSAEEFAMACLLAGWCSAPEAAKAWTEEAQRV